MRLTRFPLYIHSPTHYELARHSVWPLVAWCLGTGGCNHLYFTYSLIGNNSTIEDLLDQRLRLVS